MASKTPIIIQSHDPEVMALQAIVRGVNYFEGKNLSPRLLALLSTVELCKKSMKVEPTIEQIMAFSGMTNIEAEVESLVDQRYLTKKHNLFGDLTFTYTLGPTGGTVLRKMLSRTRTRKPAPIAMTG